MAKTKAASIQGAKSSSIKRASLDALPGSFVLSPILVKKLKIPSFIANLQARSWKNDKSFVESLAVLIGAMNNIANSPEADNKLIVYCAAMIQQFSTDNKVEIKENKEEADMEVKLTSRMLTTIETKPHINNVRQKLDTLFKQGSNNTYEDESVAFCDTVDNIEAGFDPKSDEELNDERSIHCGIFVPLFKAFGNCTQ
ncbi:hypothetical protein CU097_014756 [Rhizopus azygosporus]|uniref:Uncharacterized protein n=1 Tax=Rhizopus azygosporus TaxID=86630 RepID=A0A367K4L8_RHIAZ|nr:hypothetical protein CU097_014756 [Rhizopus azygosporus]